MDHMKPQLTERSGRKLLAECDPTPSTEMHYVYVLQSLRTSQLYYGYTNNMQRRFTEHQQQSGLWKLVYYEACGAEGDARRRERQLKHHAQALVALKGRLTGSLGSVLGVGFNSARSVTSSQGTP